jgi:predicted GIY-YIG superfamily endonuclease
MRIEEFAYPPLFYDRRFRHQRVASIGIAADLLESPSGPAVALGRGMPERNVVYVLRSTTNQDRFYVGLTSDLSTRLATHNTGGSVHTRRDRPWRLLVSLEFTSTVGAVAFERYLKSGSGRAFAKRQFN